MAHEPGFGGNPEQLRRGAGRYDERLGRERRAVGEREPERAAREVGVGHLGREKARPEALGLAAEQIDHLGSHDAVGEAGEVLDVGRDRELSAGLHAVDDQG